MKRILSLALAIFSLMLGLVGCDSSKHEHITGDWQYNESGHWQPIICSLNACNLEETPISDHADENGDHKCDVCGYEIEHKHIKGEWQYDEKYHWVSHITCTWGACDVDPGIFGHSDRNDDGKCDECNCHLKSNWYQNNLIEDGNIVKVTVSSVPVGYEYSYTGDDAIAIVDYVKSLDLITAFDENPNEYGGMTWRIFLEYEDGYSTYVLHFGKMFIRSELGSWCKMNSDEASQFDILLNELNDD